MTEYRTHTFEHEGHRLVYDVYGEGDRLIVYTHGLLVDSGFAAVEEFGDFDRNYDADATDFIIHVARKP